MGMSIRAVLWWHFGVLVCVGAAASGTYHGLQQLHAQRATTGVRVAEAAAPGALVAASGSAGLTASSAVAAVASPGAATPGDATPGDAPGHLVPLPAPSKAEAAVPPGFWFQPLPGQDGAVKRHASRTVLAASRHAGRSTASARHTAAVAVRVARPELPRPDPRVVYYYRYPGYYPYAVGYRYYPYYPRYPYYGSY